MKQYVGDFVMALLMFFTLSLTGVSVSNNQQPEKVALSSNKQHIDSLMQDTRLKTMRIKTILIQQTKDTSKKSRN